MELLVIIKTAEGYYTGPFWKVSEEQFKEYFEGRTNIEIAALVLDDGTIKEETLTAEQIGVMSDFNPIIKFDTEINEPIEDKQGNVIGYRHFRIKPDGSYSTKPYCIEFLEANTKYETKKY